MWKKSKKKKEKNPWESDDVLGAKSSSEEDNLKSWTRKRSWRTAMGSGQIDALVEMDPKAVEEMLMRCREQMTGVPEDQKM